VSIDMDIRGCRAWVFVVVNLCVSWFVGYLLEA